MIRRSVEKVVAVCEGSELHEPSFGRLFREDLLAGILSAIVLLAFSVWIIASADFTRPLEHDELLTLKYYTWVGTQADGHPQRLERRVDFDDVGAPNLRRLGVGLFCAFGRWPEPNNHVIHSLVANVTLLLGGVSETALRVAAFSGAVFLAIGVHCIARMLWPAQWWASALAVALLLCHPYVRQYAVTARGYTWMLALQVWLLIFLMRATCNTAAMLPAALCVLTAFASSINVVTTSIYVVFPSYTAAFSLRGIAKERPSASNAVRRSLLVQLWVIGSLGAVFLLDRLPFIVSSSRQYGEVVQNSKHWVQQFVQSLEMNLPSYLGLLLAFGVVFAAMTSRSGTADRNLLVIIFVSGVIFAVHTWATRRFPYARVTAFWIPLVTLTAVGGFIRILASVRGRRRPHMQLALVLSALAIITSAVYATPSPRLVDETYYNFIRITERLPECSQQVIVLADDGIPCSAWLYFPRTWQAIAERPPSNGPAQFVVVSKKDDFHGWNIPLAPAGLAREFELPQRKMIGDVSDRFRIASTKGVFREWSSDRGLKTSDLLVWYPAFESVQASAEMIHTFLEENDLRYWCGDLRYYAKLQVYGRLGVVLLPIASINHEKKVREALKLGLERFGGEVMVFDGDS